MEIIIKCITITRREISYPSGQTYFSRQPLYHSKSIRHKEKTK